MTSYSPGIGYNCSICGTWVMSGAVHSCGGSRTWPATQPENQLAQILMALGRIEQRLDALAKDKNP